MSFGHGKQILFPNLLQSQEKLSVLCDSQVLYYRNAQPLPLLYPILHLFLKGLWPQKLNFNHILSQIHWVLWCF